VNSLFAPIPKKFPVLGIFKSDGGKVNGFSMLVDNHRGLTAKRFIKVDKGNTKNYEKLEL